MLSIQIMSPQMWVAFVPSPVFFVVYIAYFTYLVSG